VPSQKSALDDDVPNHGNKNSKRKGKHSKHSAIRARVKKEEMLTKYTADTGPVGLAASAQ
jgi:hypothetical protein